MYKTSNRLGEYIQAKTILPSTIIAALFTEHLLSLTGCSAGREQDTKGTFNAITHNHLRAHSQGRRNRPGLDVRLGVESLTLS